MEVFEVVDPSTGGLVNFFSVLIAALLYYGLGYLWYSPYLFGHHDIKNVGVEKEKPKNIPLIWACIGEFVIGLIIAFGLAILIQPNNFDALGGLIIAVLIWFAFVLTTQFSAVLWGKKTFLHFCIHAGFLLVTFAIMGAILGWLS